MHDEWFRPKNPTLVEYNKGEAEDSGPCGVSVDIFTDPWWRAISFWFLSLPGAILQGLNERDIFWFIRG